MSGTTLLSAPGGTFESVSNGSAHGSIGTEAGSSAAIDRVQSQLAERIATAPGRWDAALARAFGAKSAPLRTRSELVPQVPVPAHVRFVPEGSLGKGVYGAYAADSGTVFLDDSLRERPGDLLDTYTEELGHHVDALLGGTDATGDEGAIFRDALLGSASGEATSERLREENDHGSVFVDGREIAVEFDAPDGESGADGEGLDDIAFTDTYEHERPDFLDGDVKFGFAELDEDGGLFFSGLDPNDIELDPMGYGSPDHLVVDGFTDPDGSEFDFVRFDEGLAAFGTSAESEIVPEAFSGLDFADDITIGLSPLKLGDTFAGSTGSPADRPLDFDDVAGNDYLLDTETDLYLTAEDAWPPLRPGITDDVASRDGAKETDASGETVSVANKGADKGETAKDGTPTSSGIDAEGGILSEIKSGAIRFLPGAGDFAVDTGRAFLRGAVIEPFTNMWLGHQNTLEGFGFITEEEQGERAAKIIRDLDEAGADIGAIANVLGGLPGSIIGQIVETLAVSNVDLAASEVAAELHEGTIEEDEAFWRFQAKSNGDLLNDLALVIGLTPGARAAVVSAVTGGFSAFVDAFGSVDPDLDGGEMLFEATKAGATSLALDAAFAGIEAKAKRGGSAPDAIDPEKKIPTQALLDGSLSPDEVRHHLGVNGQAYLNWAKNRYTDPEVLEFQVENMAAVIDNYRRGGSDAGSTEVLLDERADFMRRALEERGIITSPLAVPASDQSFIFRTDSRLKDEIFEKGFDVRDPESTAFVGDEHEAALYTLMNRGFSGFPISFSESGSGVLSYLMTNGGGRKAYDGSIVYIVENTDPGNMNISETMKRSPNSRVGYTPYNEVLVQNVEGVPGNRVKGAIEFSVDDDGKVTTRYFENGGYTGESPVSRAELRRRQESEER